MKALPYLLVTDEVDEAIKILCENEYFREAWIVAKMRKDESSTIFEQIFEKWAKYYNYTGFYEAGAALYCLTEKYQQAKEILLLRRNLTEEWLEVLDQLEVKMSSE